MVEGDSSRTYTVEHGFMIEVLHSCCPDIVKVYETPDAVRLATLLRSRVSDRVIMEPNTKETLVFYAPQRHYHDNSFLDRVPL